MNTIKFNNSYLYVDTSPEILNLIIQKIHPYITKVDNINNKSVKKKITIKENDDLSKYNLIKDLGYNKTLHSNNKGKYLEYENKKIVLYHNNKILVEFSNIDDITIEFHSMDDNIITELVKIIRFLLLQDYESNEGFIRAHCASIYWEDKGILLIGGKGAGKTSFFINSLRNENVKMITNDKALIDLKSRVYGLPYAVSIDKKSIKDIPEISYLSKRITDKKKYLYWPNEFSNFFNNKIITSHKIDYILNVKIDFNNEKIRVHSDNLPIPFKSILFKDIDRNSPYWLTDPDFSGEKSIIYNHKFDHLTFNIYTITGNPWKYDWIEEFSNFLSNQTYDPS